MAVLQAEQRGLANYNMIVSHVLVPPAMEAILSSPGNRVQGFLAAGHVCTIMGYEQYEPIAEKYQVPIVVTGFEPLDIMEGISLVVAQLEAGEHRVENQYTRSVQPAGNLEARRVIEQVFEVSPRTWRGMGEIPESGLCLTSEFAHFDALQRFAGPTVSFYTVNEWRFGMSKWTGAAGQTETIRMFSLRNSLYTGTSARSTDGVQ